MRTCAALVLLVACEVVAACSASTGGRRDDPRSVVLSASRINAGETGRAMLIPVDDRTQVTIIVSGVPSDLVSRPIHLYTFIYRGSCTGLDAQPSYALTDRVLAQSPASAAVSLAGGALTITNTAPVSIDALYKDDYAIRVMTSPADGNREVFCGNIRLAPQEVRGRSSH
jgi:hypothetical protein